MVVETDELKKKGKSSTFYQDEEHILSHKGKHISTTPSGFLVYRTTTPGTIRREYHAVNPKTKKVEISFDGDEKNGVLTRLLLAANKGNKIKGHEFLHHLVTYHDKVLVWDVHTIGGKIVTERLSKMKGINTHGWSEGQPINLTVDDEEYTHGPKGIRGKTHEEISAANMILITHRK